MFSPITILKNTYTYLPFKFMVYKTNERCSFMSYILFNFLTNLTAQKVSGVKMTGIKVTGVT